MTLVDENLPRGVRSFVFLFSEFCKLYLRYKTNIDPYLPEGVQPALAVLTAACSAVEAINPPGPY